MNNTFELNNWQRVCENRTMFDFSVEASKGLWLFSPVFCSKSYLGFIKLLDMEIYVHKHGVFGFSHAFLSLEKWTLKTSE